MIGRILSALRRRFVVGEVGPVTYAPPPGSTITPTRKLWPYSKNPDGEIALHGHRDLGPAFLERYSERLWQVFGARGDIDSFMEWAADQIEPTFLCRRKAASRHPAVADDDYERVDIWLTDERVAAELTLRFGGDQ